MKTTHRRANQAHHWMVGADPGGRHPMFGGIADSATSAWTTAFEVGRMALLNGILAELAIAVDESRPSVLYSPGRNRLGQLDSQAVSSTLESLLDEIRADIALRA